MKAEFQISYFLWKARKDKQGLMPLYIRSRQNIPKNSNPSQLSYNTGVKLTSQQWSNSKGEPKNKSSVLLDLERNLKETYRDLITQGYEPTLSDLLAHQNDIKKPTDKNVVAWCDDYLKSAYSEGMKKAVGTIKTNMEGFHKGLTFDKLTKPRIKAFFEYLTKQGVANNSQYKRLRALINVANHANINLPDLTSYELPYSTTNALKTRLNWAEVKAVIKTDTETSLEAVAKDVFLLACFSGLRISDILTLNRGELHDYYYERIQTKTKKPVWVTIHKYNYDLFQKYIKKGVPFTRQRLSDALKDVLDRSGMTKEITVVRQVGNEFKEVIKPKYDEIAFHSGRRFYSRLLNDLGLGGEIARDELGHGFKSITELYAGSQDHTLRVGRVRKAMESLEEVLELLAGLMKVA